jgi:phosphoribosylglycinamide formyltransferase-1
MTLNPQPRARYALLLNGSHFACEVLQALQQQGFPPDLLVLPEYPPASATSFALIEEGRPQPLSGLAGACEIAYAPRAHQARLAQRLRQAKFDFLLVACWPYLIEQTVVDSVAGRALNLHPSMLPRYPGPDPLGEQLEAGEKHLGVSLHLLSPVFDQGDILAQSPLPPGPTPGSRRGLEAACARLGSRLFIDALKGYDTGRQPIPRNEIEAGGANR